MTLYVIKMFVKYFDIKLIIYYNYKMYYVYLISRKMFMEF